MGLILCSVSVSESTELAVAEPGEGTARVPPPPPPPPPPPAAARWSGWSSGREAPHEIGWAPLLNTCAGTQSTATVT